jgi:chromatin remodeling complex protein RSC6
MQQRREWMMARSAVKRGEQETAEAEKKVKATGKPAGGARGGITAPVTPSADLAEVVGKEDMPRSEVVKKVWEYIKKHDLQDAKDKRQINADDKLANVFGKKSASMFEMNKYLSAHLTAKKD